jgi:hypothetical protein
LSKTFKRGPILSLLTQLIGWSVSFGHRYRRWLRRARLALWLLRGSPSPFLPCDFQVLEALALERANDGKPYVLAMFHHGDYHQLTHLARHVGRNVIVISTREAIRAMRLLRLQSAHYCFVERLGPAEIKEVAEGRALLAMAVDAKVPGERMAHLPMFERYRLFTLGWAEIATRLGAAVICAAQVTESGRKRVRIEVVEPQPDAFELAFRVYSAFAKWNPAFKNWDLRRQHHLFPAAGADTLAAETMEKFARTDARLRKLVAQACARRPETVVAGVAERPARQLLTTRTLQGI